MNANNSDRDVPDAALCRKIEERAYHIWLASGRRHGDHERHWFEAERELMETAKQEREQRSGVRNAYHTAEGSVLDIPGWIGSFTEDGVFNNVSGEASYRGEHLKDVVITFANMFPDVHRELYRVNVMGDVVAIELAIQGTFRGPMETPAGVI